MDGQRVPEGPGEKKGNGHSCTGWAQTRKVTTSSSVGFDTWSQASLGKEEGNVLGFLLWCPLFLPRPPQINQLLALASYTGHPKFEKATMSFYMKMALRAQTTLQNLEI